MIKEADYVPVQWATCFKCYALGEVRMMCRYDGKEFCNLICLIEHKDSQTQKGGVKCT